MKISGVYRLFEGRGAGGPTVTVHLPAKLAEELLHVLHEALEIAGDVPEDELDPLEDEDDEDELAGAEDDLAADAGGELNFEPEDDLLPAGALGDEDDDDESDEDDDDEQEQENYSPPYQSAGASQKGLADKQLEGRGRLSRVYEKHIGIKKHGKKGMAARRK